MEDTATTSQALVSDPLTKVLNRSIRHLGEIPEGPPGTPVVARDGADCVDFNGRKLFMFGDTVFRTSATTVGMITNSLLWTTDTNFADAGIDPALSGNLTANGDPAAAPIEFVPRNQMNGTQAAPDLSTTISGTYKAHTFLWPGQFFKAGTSTYVTYSKFVRFPGEACTGGFDDDHDGAVDCSDSNCANVRPCKPAGEICDNTAQLDADPELEPVDDDGDGRANCDDTDCGGHNACPFGRWVGVGLGVAQVTAHNTPADRLEDFRTNPPTDPESGIQEKRLLFAHDMPGWSHLRQDPEFGDVEVVNEGTGVNYLYVFDQYTPPNTDGVPGDDPAYVYLFRARLEDANADGKADFLQYDRWQAFKRATDGSATWVTPANKGPVLQTTRVDSPQKHLSVKKNAFHRAYLMTYINGQNQLTMRTSPTLTGNWSDPTPVHAPEGSAYVGRTLSCVDDNQGRTEYVTYALQGDVTGEAIRLKQLRFSGRGDFSGRGTTDIVLLGSATASNLPVAVSNGYSAFTSAPRALDAAFRTDAARANVKHVSGDFNGDGRGDLLLTGSTLTTLRVATSQDSGGSFTVSSPNPGTFASFASNTAASLRAVAGDFDGNGTDDVILVGGPWTTAPMAMSATNGTWTFQNKPGGDGLHWIAGVPNVKVLPGDFNGDGAGDLAYVGGADWTYVVFALSNRDGTFALQTRSASAYAWLAGNAASKPVAGDFNGDGTTDLAVVLPSGDGLGVAYVQGTTGPLTEAMISLRTGALLEVPVTDFNAYAAKANVRAIAGDFNGDNFGDIALVGAASDNRMPIAFGNASNKYLTLIHTVPSGFNVTADVKALSVY